MKKIKVIQTIINAYVVEIDENVYDDAWQKDYERGICKIDGNRNKYIAEEVARFRAIHGTGFIEGFGIFSVDGDYPYGSDVDSLAKGLNINVLSEHEDIEYDFISLPF